MRILTLLNILGLFFTQTIFAQSLSQTELTPLDIVTNTREKPQSKVWIHDNKNWTLLSDKDGAHVWRLDGNTWTKMVTVSDKETYRADCKVINNAVHIFLFNELGSALVSLEYVPKAKTYRLWSKREATVNIQLAPDTETGTIDIDSKERMWLATDEGTAITVRWSDSPYTTWSSPITVASNTDPDDIGAVVALPMFNEIGVLWSNQVTKRFGFKTHTDGTDPDVWSADELPAAQSANDVVGRGMAEDHLNMALASDGTLYCAVKTGYELEGYPRVALLVRRPSGTWDDLHQVSETGTRGIIVLNEKTKKLMVVYTEVEDGGDIQYRESSLEPIAFGPQLTLMAGDYNNPTSIKSNYTSQVVILASTTDQTKAVGVLFAEPKPAWSPAFEIYPNPFHKSSRIHFSVPNSGQYTLRLFDSKGHLAYVLQQGYTDSREDQEIKLDASKLPMGLYLVRLETNQGSQTLRLIRD